MKLCVETMFPSEIYAQLNIRSLVYIPLGTIEFHGAHLPVGLDGLTAHDICLRSAKITGGVVMPTLFYGTGGGHSDYPWTIMLSQTEMDSIISKTVDRLKSFGLKHIVLFSGHFATEQIELINKFSCKNGQCNVQALAVNMAEDVLYKPDHAGIFETTLMSGINSDLVRVDLLPQIESQRVNGDSMNNNRHDPDNPLYGIFGPDPRYYDRACGNTVLNSVVDWLVKKVSGV